MPGGWSSRANPEFFAITKRIHFHLHGEPGDGGKLGDHEAEHYEAVMKRNIEELSAIVVDGDVVILHDPQTAGIAEYLSTRGIPVVWRCHVGVDGRNEWSEDAWAFLRRYLEPFVDAYVFTRAEYAPPVGASGPAARHPPEHRPAGTEEHRAVAGGDAGDPGAHGHHRRPPQRSGALHPLGRHAWACRAVRGHHQNGTAAAAPMPRWWFR